MHPKLRGRIGLALGSGAARGWAHVGVIRGLLAEGIEPEIVCGSSSGAIVGALFSAGKLDHLEEWGRGLDWRQVASYFDFSFRGGLIEARKLLATIVATDLPDRTVESLERTFVAVATDLATGREIWLRDGPLVESVRASMALPGLITPVHLGGVWLVDGGIVNPVPVSVCRALGADSVVAVDLNTTLLGRRFGPMLPPRADQEAFEEAARDRGILPGSLQEFIADLLRWTSRAPVDGEPAPPAIYEVVANSINIMQMQIARSRMASDPPDLLVTPQLPDFGLLDFHRADEAIAEGRAAVARALLAVGKELPQPSSR